MAPATAQEISLHQRLLQGDETASAEAFDCYVDALTKHLVCRHPLIVAHSDGLIDEAVSDALFDYIARPEKYDPQKKCLSGYLCMVAEMDLLNRWRKVPQLEKNGALISFEKIVERECPVDQVEVPPFGDFVIESELAVIITRAWQAMLACAPGTNSREIVKFLDDFVELGVKPGNKYIERDANCALLRAFWKQIQTLVPDPAERRVIVLMMAGVRETDAYAQALGLTHLADKKQARAVKRVKDKLKRRLQRADWSHLIEGVGHAE